MISPKVINIKNHGRYYSNDIINIKDHDLDKILVYEGPYEKKYFHLSYCIQNPTKRNTFGNSLMQQMDVLKSVAEINICHYSIKAKTMKK